MQVSSHPPMDSPSSPSSELPLLLVELEVDVGEFVSVEPSLKPSVVPVLSFVVPVVPFVVPYPSVDVAVVPVDPVVDPLDVDELEDPELVGVTVHILKDVSVKPSLQLVHPLVPGASHDLQLESHVTHPVSVRILLSPHGHSGFVGQSQRPLAKAYPLGHLHLSLESARMFGVVHDHYIAAVQFVHVGSHIEQVPPVLRYFPEAHPHVDPWSSKPGCQERQVVSADQVLQLDEQSRHTSLPLLYFPSEQPQAPFTKTSPLGHVPIHELLEDNTNVP
jgi:hypothetical protein